ncbi:MPN domain-containing protein CG4751 isoform X2 [Eurosta solidaginis]|uniref:MPN domain-containing protein CG4751 isoform X2 n=1 Tax=Eurosta solidaginis TaxID=178769 RepID=UPI003530EEEC
MYVHVFYLDEAVAISDERDADTDEENDYEAKDNYEGLNGTARTITLQTLMHANILQPGKSLMTIDYLGQKFVGDLMADGKIKSQETETLFLTPSAWAMYCKRIINPEKKSGCGWASVKYKGKKLDAYKNSWLRKCALQRDVSMGDLVSDIDRKVYYIKPLTKRGVYAHSTAPNRNLPHDGNTLIKAVPFTSMGKVQPFQVEFNSSTLFLADFHCHLTTKEVCGYFGGHWDTNSHTLTINKAYPCRNTYFDSQLALEEEHKIKGMLLKDQLLLVGWYHSHPKFQAEPSLRDCDAQLDFQIRMRGYSDVTYTPCISTIISPYYDENPTLESVIRSIWVIPPTETKHNLEYGRPMLIEYSVLLDKNLSEYLRCELQACAKYYALLRSEFVQFGSVFNEDITFLEKLKSSLHSKFPVNPNNTSLWSWICEILGCDKEKEFISPKKLDNTDAIDSNTGLSVQYSTQSPTADLGKGSLSKTFTLEKEDIDKKGNEIKVMSLQEQLCLPSGLNMNPVRSFAPLATPNILVTGNITTLATANATSCQTPINSVVQPSHSPLEPANKYGSNITCASSSLPITEITLRDSPITVPSSSASPAKLSEVPMQSPPSPPKSESPFRSQNTPTQSPRNSFKIIQSNSNITKNDTPNTRKPQSALFSSATNDLVAASLAQLAGQLAPNFLQTDISSIFQQHLTEKNHANLPLNKFISERSEEQKTSFNETALSGYSKDFNPPHLQDSSLKNQGNLGNHKTKTESPRSALPPNFSSSASNVYKTKLLKELDNIKNDPIKISELIRSPEYASLLLHQAEALGATTLGTLGLGSDLNCLTASNFVAKDNLSQHADYSNLIHAPKALGYEAGVQQGKFDDLDTFLQQQMGAVAAAALVNVSLSSSLGTFKKQNQSDSYSQADYSYILQTYSKLFETGNILRDTASLSEVKIANVLTPLLSTSIDNDSHMFDPNPKAKDISSRIHQNENESQNHVQDSIFYQQCKSPSDLNSIFVTSSAATNLSITNKLISSNANTLSVSAPTDSAMYYSALPQDKMQDYPYSQLQQRKQDSNLFISPAALMKIQNDSLSAMMMKPPKPASSTVSSLSRTCETSTSPAAEHITPTKTGVTSPSACSTANSKYNFSATDLAVSSIQPNTAISVSLESGNISTTLRKPSTTPPVDLSSFYNESQLPPGSGSIKKRMEFSSIAELAAPPAKFFKGNEDPLSKI